MREITREEYYKAMDRDLVLEVVGSYPYENHWYTRQGRELVVMSTESKRYPKVKRYFAKD